MRQERGTKAVRGFGLLLILAAFWRAQAQNAKTRYPAIPNWQSREGN